MRGKLTEQNLTDYALNELPPEERFYVESMLACSEECREDVYQTLEFSELLKEGFEQEDMAASVELNDEQRTKVLDVPHWDFRGFFQKAAAIAILASGVAYLTTRPALWEKGGAVESITTAGTTAGEAMHGLVAEVQQKGFATTAEEFAARLERNSTWQPAAEVQVVAQPAVCTPPVWEVSTMQASVEM